jgi:Uma2 family endonuclease
MTAEELLRLPDDHLRHELIRGVLTTMPPPGFEHGAIVMELGASLHGFVRQHDLGQVLAAETGFHIEFDPDTVRAPDVSFVRKARLGEGRLPRGYWRGAPDLAAEVLSPDDRPGRVQAKVRAWLEAGTEVVWVVDPRARTVAVHTRSGVAVVREGGLLDGGDLLPGWSARVADLFP